MGDASGTIRAVSSLPSSRRSRSTHIPSFFKQAQHILGPKVATRSNALLFVIFVQTLCIVFLIFTVVAKNRAITHLARAAPNSPFSRYVDPDESRFTEPPEEYNVPSKQAARAAQFDELSPAITGFDKPLKYTSFFGKFLTCRPQPCNIDHWAYIGHKCFYRDKHIKDKSGHNASTWSIVQDGWVYAEDRDFACPVQICRRQWPQELNLTEQIVLRALQEHFKNDTPWDTRNMYTGNKYVRVNPFFGLEYTFNGYFALTKNDSSDNPSVMENRSATITIRRGFTHKFCDVSVNDNVLSREEPVYVIVPFTGRLEQLKAFYNNLKQLVDAGVSLRVVVATHGGPANVLGASELLREMQLGITEGLFSEGHLVHVIEAPGDRAQGKFSRSVALMEGSKFVPADALMFFCDVDMTIKPQFFDNCRHNTQQGHQVYYPVVYSLFPYGTKVSKEHGYWRKGAFGMVCLYKSDFENGQTVWEQGNTKEIITGWGFEDVVLHSVFNQGWRTTVFHAIEPNLLHKWHPKHCGFNGHLPACIGTILDNMGSQRFLATIVGASGTDVRNIPYKPQEVIFEDFKNTSGGTEKRMYEMPAAEGITTKTKVEEMRQMYEEEIRTGKAGILSVFAKEAMDAQSIVSAQQLQEQEEQKTQLGVHQSAVEDEGAQHEGAEHNGAGHEVAGHDDAGHQVAGQEIAGQKIVAHEVAGHEGIGRGGANQMEEAHRDSPGGDAAREPAAR